MNCTELFFDRVKEKKGATALWMPSAPSVTFEELAKLSWNARREVERRGLKPGDACLLFMGLSPELYGWIIGLLSSGVSVVLVEPWMPIARINHVLPLIKPKAFVTSFLGRAWGARVESIRAIPHWISHTSLRQGSGESLSPVGVSGETPGIITFTSGTTGAPKGMVRTQAYLQVQHEILSKAEESFKYKKSDLCIFANFALSNLALGRTSLIIPSGWKANDLKKLESLPKDLEPDTLTAGPAFLLNLMKEAPNVPLKSIHIGGALTDCNIFEKGFKLWPEAHWSHLYGSTEVEPVALIDAKEAVKKSRERGYFQTLLLGNPIQEIESKFEPNTVWVSGPHVCPKYLANEEENRKNKRLEDGKIWHKMGDRIVADTDGWWHRGRESQRQEDFLLEQKLYTALQSSTAFLYRDASGVLYVFSEKVKEREATLKSVVPEAKILETKIVRDHRHRARIDREKSRKGRP